MSQTVAKNRAGDKAGMPALSPYEELMWRTLQAALRYPARHFVWEGWFRLDAVGRRELEQEHGLDRHDLERAINYGVATGLLSRRVFGGQPRIKLAEQLREEERLSRQGGERL